MKLFLAALIAMVIPLVARGDPRPFTFTTDAYSIGKGNVEYEQWVTLQKHTDDDSDFTRVQLRHEFEFGLADNFDLSVYLASWSYEDSDSRTGTQFDSSSIEGVFYVLNPATDAVGLALYAEFGVGQDELEFEQKLIVQKDIERLTLAYNLVIETELEGVFKTDEENETEAVLGHRFGVSYAASNAWKLGGELSVETDFEDWSHGGDTTVYAGPVASYQGGSLFGSSLGWWATLTPMFQLSSISDVPDLEVRLIVGIEF